MSIKCNILINLKIIVIKVSKLSLNRRTLRMRSMRFTLATTEVRGQRSVPVLETSVQDSLHKTLRIWEYPTTNVHMEEMKLIL